MNLEKLERLSELRQSGALSEKEFNVQKELLLSPETGLLSKKTQRQHLDRDGSKKIVNKQTKLKRLGVVIGLLGLITAGYAQFGFDPTVSPMDGLNRSEHTDLSPQDELDEINDILDRYQRTLAGERTVNLYKLEEQRRLFNFGLALTLLGAGTFGWAHRKGR